MGSSSIKRIVLAITVPYTQAIIGAAPVPLATPHYSATITVTGRIAVSRNVPEGSCRCLSHLFLRISALSGLRFGWLQMISDVRSLQIAQRFRGHLRLRVPIGAEHK